jgi:excisionase family DNA binding protein
MSPKLYTTTEAARAVGITRVTLQRWIASGKLKAPRPQLRDGVGVRLWTESNIARLLAAKKKIYGKGRGRKKK